MRRTEPKERHTDWNAVAMAGLITFLSAVENTVVGMSEWPYMHTIDPDATSQFFGLVSSVSKLGHAAFAVVFAFWAYKTHSIKAPLIVGRAIAFFSCCVYLCVEVLPYGRRFLMLFCYFLFGVASSSSTVLRAYMVAVSTTEDRARAYSAIAVANMISVVIGPVCQLAFTHMPYPGYEIIENLLKFHIYSAPIWIASATNFISVAIIWFGLRDVPSSGKRDKTAGTGCNPEEYTWCDTAYSTWPVLFLPITCVVMGVGVPTAAIALDTIYSKILGNIDQVILRTQRYFVHSVPDIDLLMHHAVFIDRNLSKITKISIQARQKKKKG
ncbi:hypothetical protein TELCIR_06813 [Teladorsagia circumcincta]|uniref:Major facilitator superfamily (MFS) profile domain-containing protein n=1 Tax=Teladorsagia circumcincta TaxID=45464 RepID=A0A2G9UM39_TELCI|nr:hypothetical protein TELCIR_06813 [Teladorsagia circumcincta]